MTPGPPRPRWGPHGPRRKAKTAPASSYLFLQLVGGSAGGGDLLLGGPGEGVRLHLDRDGDLARAEDLHRTAAAHRAPGRQVLGGDLAALRVEFGDPVQVHDLVLHLVRVLEALELRNPADQRHLAALEPDGHGGARLGALGAAARGLALGRLAATLADLAAVRTGSGTQVVHLQRTPAGAGGLVLLEISRHVSRPPRRRRGAPPSGSCRAPRAGPPGPRSARSSSGRGCAACHAGSASR